MGGDHCRLADEPVSERDCSLMPCDWLGHSNELEEGNEGQGHEEGGHEDDNAIDRLGHLKDRRGKGAWLGKKADAAGLKSSKNEDGEAVSNKEMYQWIPLFWSEVIIYFEISTLSASYCKRKCYIHAVVRAVFTAVWRRDAGEEAHVCGQEHDE